MVSNQLHTHVNGAGYGENEAAAYLFRSFQNYVFREQLLSFDTRVVAGRLRTVGAVFGAPARLDRQQCTLLHFSPFMRALVHLRLANN